MVIRLIGFAVVLSEAIFLQRIDDPGTAGGR